MKFEEAYKLLEELSEGINDPGIFKAVFTAGGPGSGKSTVANKLGLQAMGLRPINSDAPFEMALKKAGLSFDLETLDPEVIDTMRVSAKQLSGKQLDLAIKGRLGLIIDSTARNTARIAKQKAMLESLGYETAMLFVDTNLDTAIERNKMRHAEGGRAVPSAVVKKSHKEIQANKLKLKKIFGSNFWVIPNDGTMKDMERNTTKWFSKVKSWVSKRPTNKAAKDWMSTFESEYNKYAEEMIISELDLRSPARRDKTRMMSAMAASEKKLMKKMMENPKTAIRDLKITIDVFNRQIKNATKLTEPIIQAQIDKYMDWLQMLSGGKQVTEAKFKPDRHLIKFVEKMSDKELLDALKNQHKTELPMKMVQHIKYVMGERGLKEETLEEKFNDKQLDLLRKQYSKIKKIDPNSDAYKKLKKAINGFDKESLRALADAKPAVPWLSMMAKFALNETFDVVTEALEKGDIMLKEEGTTTASIPQGPESVGVKPDGKFAGNPVFKCDDETFSKCMAGKKKYGRWSTYLGKDNPFYAKMQSWMKQSYKNKNFLLQNDKSGAMVWARNPLGESFNPEKEAAVATKKIDASRKKHRASLKKMSNSSLMKSIEAYPKKDYISPTMLADYMDELKSRGVKYKNGKWVESVNEGRQDWLALKKLIGSEGYKFGSEVKKKIAKIKKSRFKNIPNPGSHLQMLSVEDVTMVDPMNPFDYHVSIDFKLEYTGATSLTNDLRFTITREPEEGNEKVVIYKMLSRESQGTYRMNAKDKPANVIASLIQRYYDSVVLPKVAADIKAFASHTQKNPPRQPLPGAGRDW